MKLRISRAVSYTHLVENHVNGAVWAFDYDKMFCVLMENEICRKVCEKNKYNSWMKLIGQYCISMA